MRGSWLKNLGFTYLDLDGLYALDVTRKWGQVTGPPISKRQPPATPI